MNDINIPRSICIKEILKENYSLSPSNYKKISIRRDNVCELREYLKQQNPYTKGIEPGTFAYVEQSNINFIRNSCITKDNIKWREDKAIFLNPNYDFENQLGSADILLCKDANIGDSCYFVSENPDCKYVFSSGMVKLNFKKEAEKYFVLAFLRDNYFRLQLESLTPKGATIRHANDKFMKCMIPVLKQNEEWIIAAMEGLIKNIAHCEKICANKLNEACRLIDEELFDINCGYEKPSLSRLLAEERLDAGLYSENTYKTLKCVENYIYGSATLEDYGYRIKRGPNLQKRDLGRSIQTNIYTKDYFTLIYPSDIAVGGYITKSVYLGASGPVWELGIGDILFSAEGSVGKTFAICSAELKFTTNIHGMIIYPISKKIDLSRSILICLYLHYLKNKGVIDQITVGGQGGSLAVGYWDKIKIPYFPDSLIKKLTQLYNQKTDIYAFSFNEKNLKNNGIYQLNTIRLLCQSLLNIIVRDIKSDSLKTLDYYEQQTL
ncbi:MAG: hypothetical protein KHX31_05505 [Akkermansia sp.]|uniref:hypothetical protein n=1 Tax=Akkermansia sp. TaxID=1872421 RepID=UPI0025BF9451|nr:hypothetical protein [Akkermansia sp.]MBS5508075.1 hypothetical protein [Akkermansia sp.]